MECNFRFSKLYEWGYETPTGEFWAYYLVWFYIVMALGISTLIHRYYKEKDQAKKKQTSYVLAAVIVPSIIGSLINGLFPLFNLFVFILVKGIN